MNVLHTELLVCVYNADIEGQRGDGCDSLRINLHVVKSKCLSAAFSLGSGQAGSGTGYVEQLDRKEGGGCRVLLGF